MERSSEAREMSQAADRITGAVQELSRAVDRLAELEERRSTPLSDEEADRAADAAVHRVRREIGEEERGMYRESAPTAEQVRARRDERRRREGYPDYHAS